LRSISFIVILQIALLVPAEAGRVKGYPILPDVPELFGLQEPQRE
jgi:hypothetical protein